MRHTSKSRFELTTHLARLTERLAMVQDCL